MEKKQTTYAATDAKNQSGAATVEFALIVPILILLVFGIIQFGIAFNNQLAITHAAREGARLAAVGAFSEDKVRTSAYPVEPDSVSLSYPNGNEHGEPVEVRILYNLNINIPLFGSRTLPLEGKARMRLEV